MQQDAARVAVFRALQLGDMLCAVPALRSLRAGMPGAHITLVGLPWASAFAERFGAYIDEFVDFPGWPGLPETVVRASALPRFIATMRSRHFDLALQLHGSGAITNPLIAKFGARTTAGFAVPGAYTPDTARFIPWPEGTTEVDRLLALTRHLGMPATGDHLEWPVLPPDLAERDALLRQHALNHRDFAIIHPGARMPSRRWPPERFAAVADALANDGLRVVLTGAIGEQAITRRVAATMRASATDLAGETTLGGLAALVASARIVVCNDTGISHIAAAVRTPSVVIASGSDVQRWAPGDRDRHHVLWHAVECRPCSFQDCPIEGHPCATGVTVNRVLAETRAMLAGNAVAV